jgi:hypothetical protein
MLVSVPRTLLRWQTLPDHTQNCQRQISGHSKLEAPSLRSNLLEALQHVTDHTARYEPGRLSGEEEKCTRFRRIATLGSDNRLIVIEHWVICKEEKNATHLFVQ